MRLIETPLRALGQRDRDTWRRLAAPDGWLTSPYLLPEFADLVNDQRGDVRVVIAEDDDGPAGYFACHAPSGGVVRPVGAPLSDYQGFAARPGFSVKSAQLLECLGAGALIYDNWYGDAPGRARERAGSAIIDLGCGAPAWLDNRSRLHRSHFKKIAQRRRKAEREFGPVRVVFGDPLGERYAAMQRWKSAQYRDSGLLDLFTVPWAQGVIAGAASRAFGPFRGLTASLYLGDTLAAVETGLAAGGVYHSWFPAYDPRFASVSPGLLLLHGIIENAHKLGFERIDLGKGEQAYKTYYIDYEAPISGGRALASGFAAARVAGWELAEAAGSVLPGPLAAAPMKLRRRWSQTAAFEPGYAARLTRFAHAFTAAPKRLTA